MFIREYYTETLKGHSDGKVFELKLCSNDFAFSCKKHCISLRNVAFPSKTFFVSEHKVS